MWEDLFMLQPRSSSGGAGISREGHIGNVSKDVASKVPILKLDIGHYDLMIIREKLLRRNTGAAKLEPTPCQIVLLQELERWNYLAMAMMSSLIMLQKSLVGEIGMSDQ